MNRSRIVALAIAGMTAWAGVASAITIETVPVGDPGNANDPATGHGKVNYAYNIGKYDVTAGQYTAFLNAVATTADRYGLYNSNMAAGNFAACGISQTLVSGRYTYATTSNPNFPVNYVTYWNACRFANWLSNGQPTVPEGSGSTETGSYTLT